MNNTIKNKIGKKRKILLYTAGSITLLLLLFFIPLLFFQKPAIIMLSFDTEIVDSDEILRGLLDILAANNIKATFFVMGQLAKERPYIIKEIYNKGHEIACHTYSHPNLMKLNLTQQELEIEECQFTIKKVIGENPLGFRAPYRRENTITQKVIREHAFDYDASAFENIPFFFPASQVDYIKTSSYSIFTLCDYMMLNFFMLPKQLYFWLLKNKLGKTASFAFHPRIIMKYHEEFNNMCGEWIKEGVLFKTHIEYYRETIEKNHNKKIS